MLDFAKKTVDYLKPWKTIPAFMEAVKKARETKDVGFFEKIKIFWASFQKEMKGVEEEEKAATDEATEGVAKPIDATMEEATEVVGLEGDVEDEDRQFYDEVVSMGLLSVKEVDKDSKGKVHSGLSKIDKAAKDEDTEPLDIEESMAVASAGIMTLRKLRKRYPTKAEFQKALERIAKLAPKSKYPLQRLLSDNVLKLFRLRDEDEGLKFLGRFGIGVSAGDIAGKAASLVGVDIKGGEASHAKEMLESLASSPIKNLKEVTAFMKEHFFPQTSAGNVKLAVKKINELIREKTTKIPAETLTELVFLIDDSDYQRLAGVLVGRRGTAVEKAA